MAKRHKRAAGGGGSGPNRSPAGPSKPSNPSAALDNSLLMEKQGDDDVIMEKQGDDDEWQWWTWWQENQETDTPTTDTSWADALADWWSDEEDVTPAVDTPAPAPEVVTPAAPEVDTPTPEVDTPTPEVDTPTPEVDTPTPEVDTPAPEVAEEVASVVEAEEEAEEAGPVDLAMRATTFRVGQYGALITAGGPQRIDLHTEASADAGVAHTVADGTAVKVVSVDGGFLEVEFNKGDKPTTGWVAKALFSDQPRLFHDDDDKNLMEGHTWTLVQGDQTTDELAGTDVQQGGLADCYFIAAMNAVGNANADFMEESMKYNAATGIYSFRFFEEAGWDSEANKPKYDEVWIEVDGYLPTQGNSQDGAYASAASGKNQWGALYEKAYAKWKGGYEAMGDGGYGSTAMEELAGAKSDYNSTSSMSEEEVIPYFTDAEDKGLAVYCGSHESLEHEAQTPLKGAESGPYTGKLNQPHRWNEIHPSSVRIEDAGGNVGTATDSGSYGDKTGELSGSDVKDGEVSYKDSRISVEYDAEKGPEKAEDLVVHSNTRGMLYPAKQVIGWHGYSFEKVVDKEGSPKIQLYNPWGSYQPKALTAAEFLKYYGSLSTVQVPQAKGES